MGRTAELDEAAPPHQPVKGPWRPDIQGLRAIAVLTVVILHAGLPLPGGFVGVDMFFVISGYVITAMLLREHERTGQIDFRHFYLRRIKRLTPALGVMVTVTLIAAALFLSPFGVQQDAALTGIGAMLLAANYVIWRTTGSYFDVAAETNPLLHTWSLSVEEQFYLVFPLLLAVSWRLSRQQGMRQFAPLLGVALLGVLSLAAIPGAFLLGEDSWLTSFYSPVNRAWEFAAGALLAMAVSKWQWELSTRVASWLALLGGIVLAASLVLINSETPFPSAWTLLPVLATVLLITAGLGSNPISKNLSRPGVVAIGDLSYSIYLWHWPFIVFAAALWPETPWATVVAAAVSVLAAIASYRIVEQPMRGVKFPLSRGAKLSLAGFVAVPVVVSAAVWAIATYFTAPAYGNGRIAPAFESGTIGTTTWLPCDNLQLQELAKSSSPNLCLQTQAKGAPAIALLGDSHARHLLYGLASQFPNDNVFAYINYNDEFDAEVTGYRAVVDYVLNEPSIETVVLANYWELRGVPEASLSRLLDRLTLGGKSVVLVDDVPDFPFEAVECEYRKAPVIPLQECDVSVGSIFETRSAQSSKLASLADTRPNVAFVPSLSYFCDDTVCSMLLGSTMGYVDTDHLSEVGSRYWAERVLMDPSLRLAFPQPS